jgi:hypothetical protein
MLFAAAPAAGASLLPDLSGPPAIPGFERETTTPGCPLGVALLPGSICPPTEQLDPAEAEADAAANPPPRGRAITGTPAPYSAHSMIYSCCTPAAQKERAFAAARATGAGYIRLDVNLRGVFAVRSGKPRRPDWAGLDQISVLARRYRIPVVATLTHVPDNITQCINDNRRTCPAGDYEAYGRYVALIAQRLDGVATYFEVVNEPDGRWAFRGSPSEYARMLEAARRHIRTSVPKARILLGGLMYQDKKWITQMLDTPGVNAIRQFDVANVHLRGKASRLGGAVKRWREYFAKRGFRGPLWVTEHGYPGRTLYQYDRTFRGGEVAQAAFLGRSLPALRKAGARQVFVTLRDSWRSEFLGEYASEGVIALAERSPYSVRRKPSFEVVTQLTASWRKAERLRVLRKRHLNAAKRAKRAGRKASYRKHRRLARRYALRIKKVQY